MFSDFDEQKTRIAVQTQGISQVADCINKCETDRDSLFPVQVSRRDD